MAMTAWSAKVVTSSICFPVNGCCTVLPTKIVLCRPDAWVRVSFAHTRVSIVGWVYDPDPSLPAGMYVDVPHLDCLLVAAPVTLEGALCSLRTCVCLCGPSTPRACRTTSAFAPRGF